MGLFGKLFGSDKANTGSKDDSAERLKKFEESFASELKTLDYASVFSDLASTIPTAINKLELKLHSVTINTPEEKKYTLIVDQSPLDNIHVKEISLTLSISESYGMKDREVRVAIAVNGIINKKHFPEPSPERTKIIELILIKELMLKEMVTNIFDNNVKILNAAPPTISLTQSTIVKFQGHLK